MQNKNFNPRRRGGLESSEPHGPGPAFNPTRLEYQEPEAHLFETNPMMGFKSWWSAESTIAGYELVNMLRKGQHIHAENMTVYDQFYALAA